MYTVMDTKNNPIERYPIGTSEEYIIARNDLLKAEWELRDQLERVASMRRSLPRGATMKTYTFHEGPEDINQTGPITTTTLADLTPADGRSLVVEHLMFGAKADTPCPMCASFLDGLNAVAPHLGQFVNFAVVAKAPIETLRTYAARRGWNKVRLLSSFESDFNTDMHVENPAWMAGADQLPAVSVFRKEADGVVGHVYTVSANYDRETGRGMDLLSPIWNILDLTPEGRGDRDLSNEYVKLKT